MVNIKLENISVALGSRTVVRSISTELEAGTLIGIIGPNGAGKSTLVRAILGLIPVTSGHCLINGQDVTGMKRGDVARKITYLPQGQTLHWPLSVERLAGLGRLPHVGPLSCLSQDDSAAIERALQKSDVVMLRSRIATELSGGERARVMLARALAGEAPGLVADEPLAALDPGHQIDVMELLVDEAREGKLVIAVMHDLNMAARYCGRILLLDEGVLIADGPPENVLTPDLLRKVYAIDTRIDFTGPAPALSVLGRTAKQHQ